MNLTLLIYLASVFESIGVLTVICVIGSLACFILMAIIYLHSLDDGEDMLKSLTGKIHLAIKVFLISAIICCLTPSKSTMYLMIGAKYLSSSEIPPKVLNILNERLDQVLASTKKKAKDD